MITKNTLNQSYRLASSYVMTLSGCLFYGIPVVSNFSVSGCSFFYSYGFGNDSISGIRPAVSLKPDVNLSDSGDGTLNIN